MDLRHQVLVSDTRVYERRQSCDGLIFNMEISTPWKPGLYIETGPRSKIYVETADALVPTIARSSASMVLTMMDNWVCFYGPVNVMTWWCHQMEIFSMLLALCAGNSLVTGEFPTQRPVTRSFDVSFHLHPNKCLCKQLKHQWFETPSSSLLHHCNEIDKFSMLMALCVGNRGFPSQMSNNAALKFSLMLASVHC